MMQSKIMGLEPNQEIFTLEVQGMKCAGCVQAVEKQLVRVPGVVSASVNLVTQVATVACDADAVQPQALAQQLTNTGFPTQIRTAVPETSPDLGSHERQASQGLIRQVAIASTLFLLSSLGHLAAWGHFTALGLDQMGWHGLLATVAILGPGRSILVDGWRGLWHGVPTMNTLVGLGMVSAYLTSLAALMWPQLGWECFFDEPVMLLGFILLGRVLEQQARNRAATSLGALLALKPPTARLTGDPATTPGSGFEIPTSQVRVGDYLQVLSGERVPVDGTVVTGQTSVNEAMVTGESLPVAKQPGDGLMAGTLNQSGAVILRASATGADTTLARIIAMVEAAQARKAPIQRLADTIAGYFAYGVMAIATLTFLFWYGLGTQIWPQVLVTPHPSALNSGHLLATHTLMAIDGVSHSAPLLLSLKLAIAVLVIACPCALGLATPTAILVGTGLGAERGLLIRGGDILEETQGVDTVVFDKTGTLTTGQPTVTDCMSVVADQSLLPDALLQLAASAEQGTCHPLAIALQQAAKQQGLPLLPSQDFQTYPGQGITAQVGEAWICIGTSLWFQNQGLVVEDRVQHQVQALAAQGKTVALVARNHVVVGIIAVMDPLKPDAQVALAGLKAKGFDLQVLTGDQTAAAQALGEILGLASGQVMAQVQPGEKAAVIRDLQAQGHTVAMVGDGINDGPALAQANVGIALNSGTDVAIETAQIVLMGDRLMDVLAALELSQATFRKIRQNLFWALGYNALAIPIAAGALLPSFNLVLSPAAAGALMAFSSVSVVTNSLLLSHERPLAGKS